MSNEPTQRQRSEHAWLLQLKQSQAFAYYSDELVSLMDHAMRETCAEQTQHREYHAGRLAAFRDALTLVDKKYQQLAKVVEVIA